MATKTFECSNKNGCAMAQLDAYRKQIAKERGVPACRVDLHETQEGSCVSDWDTLKRPRVSSCATKIYART